MKHPEFPCPLCGTKLTPPRTGDGPTIYNPDAYVHWCPNPKCGRIVAINEKTGEVLTKFPPKEEQVKKKEAPKPRRRR